ncbi:hypothetical protein BDU57DRAFT_11135 [Ampelomyces quisqualis]|uniref:Secreted protein n=1 Tax=Ampelomyces quisqualis TaxID=50730 RepID=A0A6A5QZT0_AMPQU|nr:hypothetical protein BDU57DRAFT_11135 [Ampelomyces quisqualis]
MLCTATVLIIWGARGCPSCLFSDISPAREEGLGSSRSCVDRVSVMCGKEGFVDRRAVLRFCLGHTVHWVQERWSGQLFMCSDLDGSTYAIVCW